MVDADKVRRLTQVLLDALADLERYARKFTEAELSSNRDAQHMVLHAMYIAVQATVDLAMHIAADRGLPQPATYRAVFRELADADIIAAPLASRLEAWTGFRNVLAHLYSVVDYARVYAALGEIGDLRDFVQAVQPLLKNE